MVKDSDSPATRHKGSQIEGEEEGSARARPLVRVNSRSAHWERLPAEDVGRNVFFTPLSGDRTDGLLDVFGPGKRGLRYGLSSSRGSLGAQDEFGSQLSDARFAQACAGFFGGTMEGYYLVAGNE